MSDMYYPDSWLTVGREEQVFVTRKQVRDIALRARTAEPACFVDNLPHRRGARENDHVLRRCLDLSARR